LGAKNAWLGCPDEICDLRMCPSGNGAYRHFGTGYSGEEFQIIGEGTTHNPIKCGQQIRLRFVFRDNTWMAAHTIIAVTKDPVLVQLPKPATLIGVEEKSSEYMLVGEKMEK